MANIYRLPPKLDLAAASPLAMDLGARLDDDLVLDAADVTQIGALCAQVISSAGLSFRAAEHRLTMINATDRVIEQLGHLGLTPETVVEVCA